MNELEESEIFTPDFTKLKNINDNVLPVVVQDSKSREVLIIAYVNELALQESLKQKRVVFWSTSRKELWVKGETSGDVLFLDEVRINCEQNSFLFLVTPQRRGACHTKDKNGDTRPSCYYRKLNNSKKLLHLNNS